MHFHDQCRGCITGINCCLTSQPCFNNGICKPLSENSTQFSCDCIDGYTGQRCTEKPTPQMKPKSCRGFLNENNQTGIFTILDSNDRPYEVYCSFASNMAWTLVQSFKYSHRGGYRFPIYEDNPKNQHSPSWADYRLSWSRMSSIHEDSNKKWRLTCNFDTDGMVYKDYVIATHANIPLLPPNSEHNRCKRVESIDIRGKGSCVNCNMVVRHKNGLGLHIDSYHSSNDCSTNFLGSTACSGGQGEDNFGFYECVNKQHLCSSSEESTTQLWFGGQ